MVHAGAGMPAAAALQADTVPVVDNRKHLVERGVAVIGNTAVDNTVDPVVLVVGSLAGPGVWAAVMIVENKVVFELCLRVKIELMEIYLRWIQ